METFTQIAILIAIATVIGGIMRILKQPLIMGHIVTGIIVGPHFLNIFAHNQSTETFSIMGISILLFIVGLNLSPKVIRDVGKASLVTGIGQVLFTTVVGFIMCRLLGYSTLTATYVAIAMTFSSTIIVLKLLSDKKDLETLYGRIAIGFLLVQDVIATMLMIAITSFTVGGDIVTTSLLMIIKGLAITLVLSLISFKVLPKLSDFFAKSTEYLFLFVLGWGFGLAAIFHLIGFSVEIGALIAGITLAMSPYAHEMSTKLKPLRDFFITMFFILLGANMDLNGISDLIGHALLFSIYILIGNPIIMQVLMGFMGYNKRTGFNAGLTVAQISEFSLILISLGVKVGHIDHRILSLVTLIGLITISLSTYMILYSEKIYQRLAPYLSIFERHRTSPENSIVSNYDFILFGCHRVGYDFIKTFRQLGSGFLAVDFDPEVVARLKKQGINVEYGDAEDDEYLEEINVNSAKFIVSTIPDFDTNLFILNKVRSTNKESGVILISYNIDDALKFYENGATYVIMPHFIGGEFAAELAHEASLDASNLKAERDGHIESLKRRKELGHVHPVWLHYH